MLGTVTVQLTKAEVNKVFKDATKEDATKPQQQQGCGSDAGSKSCP